MRISRGEVVIAKARGMNGGGGGIRTHEAFRPAGFQDRSHQPLDHPSSFALPFWHPAADEQVCRSRRGQCWSAMLRHPERSEGTSQLTSGALSKIARSFASLRMTTFNGREYWTSQYVHVNLSHGGVESEK